MNTENQVFDDTICRMQRWQTAALKARRTGNPPEGASHCLGKNPAAGKIQADSIGQIILENSVAENHWEMFSNQTEAKV